MVRAKTKTALYNAYITVDEGTECVIKKVWLNDSCNDVYVQIDFNGVEMITSISDIEIINQGLLNVL